jgi:hypothetical protein
MLAEFGLEPPKAPKPRIVSVEQAEKESNRGGL